MITNRWCISGFFGDDNGCQGNSLSGIPIFVHLLDGTHVDICLCLQHKAD